MMKRIIGLLLLLACCLCLFGCKEEVPELQAPVRFYYPRTEPAFGKEDGVIAYELRESAGHEQDYTYLLELYLKGPESESFSRTLPKNVALENLTVTDTYAVVVLSDAVARISGLDLTMACACLTTTITELTGVQTVTIRAKTLLLDGNQFITMDRDKLLLLDSSTADQNRN